MSQIECPEYHTERNRLVCFKGLFDASLHADRFVAISEYSRMRFLKWFPHVAPERVSVVYRPRGRRFATPLTEEERDSVLRKFDLVPDGFWLAVGTIEPRKNYGLLLEVYAQLIAELPGHVSPCASRTGGMDRIVAGPSHPPTGLDDRVRCLGFVEDAELAALYRACFGLSIRRSTKVSACPSSKRWRAAPRSSRCDRPVLPEVVGGAGLLVAPQSPAAYLDAMKQLVLEPSRRAELRTAAPQQAARFSWQRSAARLLDLYQSVSIGRCLTGSASDRHEDSPYRRRRDVHS